VGLNAVRPSCQRPATAIEPLIDRKTTPQRRALEPLRLGLTGGDADHKRAAKVNARQLRGGVAERIRRGALLGFAQRGSQGGRGGTRQSCAVGWPES
jgi:hypothetical protein